MKFMIETPQSEGRIAFEADSLHTSGPVIDFILPIENSIYVSARNVAKIDLVNYSDSLNKTTAWLIDNLSDTMTAHVSKTIWANPEMLRKAVQR
jgi:hypothetical protein